jgi:Ankyrin repeats (3 copies)
LAASRNGHAEVVDILLEHGANMSMVDFGGDTALLLAARGGHEKIMESLLKKGADSNFANGESALHIAVKRQSPSMVALLLEYRADPFSVDQNKKHPSELAVEGKRPDIAAMLAAQEKQALNRTKTGAQCLDEVTAQVHQRAELNCRAECAAQSGAEVCSVRLSRCETTSGADGIDACKRSLDMCLAAAEVTVSQECQEGCMEKAGARACGR